METHNSDTFRYTYSSRDQEEIKRIRDKYLDQPEDKMEQLRRLDRSVTRKRTVISLLLGIVGTLIMGLGMSLAMDVLGEGMLIPGILIGITGIALLSIAYPIYNRITQKEREKLAPIILKLTDELMK